MQQLDAIFTEILTKQAQANEQRKQSGNTKNGAKNVSGSLSFTKQNTAAAVQGLPAEATGNQDNTRGARPDASDIPTNQEESGEVSKFTDILNKQAKQNYSRNKGANTGNREESVSEVLPDAQKDTAAAVQGLPAKSREGQDNNRSTRANQANLSTNQEKSAEVSEVI